MKLSRADVRGKATLGMELRFETQDLTSYSGPQRSPHVLCQVYNLVH